LKEGHNGFAIVSRFPDEFHDYIWDMVKPLEEKFNARYDEILNGYSNVIDSFMSDGSEFDRGRFARSIKDAKDKRYYFLLLDNKPISTVLWQELRPREAPHEQSETQSLETYGKEPRNGFRQVDR
jgi:hypothetical protein